MDRYYVFAFSERTESMKFFDKLRRNGVYSALINTPRIITLGCGLSVRLTAGNYPYAVKVVSSSDYRTFLGAYEIVRSYEGSSVRRVIG